MEYNLRAINVNDDEHLRNRRKFFVFGLGLGLGLTGFKQIRLTAFDNVERCLCLWYYFFFYFFFLGLLTFLILWQCH